MLLNVQACSTLIAAICLALSGAFIAYYNIEYMKYEFDIFSIPILVLVYCQAVYIHHRLRSSSLEQNRLLIGVTYERDEFKSILGALCSI